MLAAGSYMGRVPGMAHHTGGSMLGRSIRYGSQHRAVRGAGLGTTAVDWSAAVGGTAAGSAGSGFDWNAAFGFTQQAVGLATAIIGATSQQTSNPYVPAQPPAHDAGEDAWRRDVLMQQQQWQQQMMAAEQLRLAREGSKSMDGGVSTNTLLLLGGGAVVVLAAVMLLRK